MIHRDIKPANIFMCPDNIVKVGACGCVGVWRDAGRDARSPLLPGVWLPLLGHAVAHNLLLVLLLVVVVVCCRWVTWVWPRRSTRPATHRP